MATIKRGYSKFAFKKVLFAFFTEKRLIENFPSNSSKEPIEGTHRKNSPYSMKFFGYSIHDFNSLNNIN